MAFREITPYELEGNLFKMIAKDWALITAEADGKANAMTISWGGFGQLWNELVAFTFVRPQRYTYGLTEASDVYSVSFYEEKYRKELGYFGSASGRDEDKIAKCGFTVHQEDGAVCFHEARLALVCRKLYVQDLKEECFTDPKVALQNYAEKDYHRMFIGEIEKVLKAVD